MKNGSAQQLRRREISWLLITAAGLILVYLSPLREHVRHVQDFRDEIISLGHFGPLVYVTALALLTAIGFPRLVLFPLGGLVFGFGWGFVWSIAGALAGAYATFVYARLAGQSVVMKRWPALHRMSLALEGRGFVTVALMRQLPAPGHVTNIFLGISPVTHTAFLVGTLLGAIPSAIPTIMVGSSAMQASTRERMIYLGVALGALFLSWALGVAGLKYSRRLRELRELR